MAKEPTIRLDYNLGSSQKKFLNKYCPPARTAKKMEEINNFQQESDESLFRAWERFKELLMKCPQHYLTNIQEVIIFYNGLDVPTRQILDLKGAIPSKTIADAKIAIQEMVEYSQKWHNGTPSRTKSTKTFDGLATIQAQLNNLGREIKKALVDLRASVSVMPFSTYTKRSIENLSHTRMTIELADRTIKQPKGIATNVLVRIEKFVFPIEFVILDIPEDEDVPLILGRPFLSTAHVKIDVFKRKVTLRVGDEKLVFKSIKPTSSVIKRVFMDK
nr:hypothetical protein [Tanacetum cinerariifolium]